MEARERVIPTDLRCNLEETLLQQLKPKWMTELYEYGVSVKIPLMKNS